MIPDASLLAPFDMPTRRLVRALGQLALDELPKR